MNKGRKLGPRQYSSGENVLMVQDLFLNQAIVTLKDICNETGCCRQTAARYLDIVSLFLPIYQVMDSVPYELVRRKAGGQERQYSTLKTRRKIIKTRRKINGKI
ncbi:MAG: hypothetical protein GY710_02080 [Desulfobacteraceae bacterium]|nr:hypothetical protein [Desulfobacteraceae bacterium]